MEMLDIVDENGVPTGKTVERGEAHQRGIRHRTSHVWIYRIHSGRRQLLLQKRSRNKDSFPGCYDISSAGHIPAGQGFEESALRELKEELGVDVKEEQLVFCGIRRFGFRKNFHGRDFCENQVSSVYALPLDRDENTFTVQESEVESVTWMDWDDCVNMVNTGSAPNCVMLEELDMIKKTVLSGV